MFEEDIVELREGIHKYEDVRDLQLLGIPEYHPIINIREILRWNIEGVPSCDAEIADCIVWHKVHHSLNLVLFLNALFWVELIESVQPNDCFVLSVEIRNH